MTPGAPVEGGGVTGGRRAGEICIGVEGVILVDSGVGEQFIKKIQRQQREYTWVMVSGQSKERHDWLDHVYILLAHSVNV